MGRVTPWTPEEVAALRAYQACEDLHSLTCPRHSSVDLEVYRFGLICPLPTCDYEQDWVPTAMTQPDFVSQVTGLSRKDAR